MRKGQEHQQLAKRSFFQRLFLFALILLSVLLYSACGSEEAEYEIRDSAGASSGNTDSTEDAAPVRASDESGAQSSSSGEEADGEVTPADPPAVVYVCGAVRQPGVYTLPSGSRICDALEAAGGMLENADGRVLNLAAQVSDGQQITVYTLDETEADPGIAARENSTSSVPAEKAPVNINTAGAEELMTLTGIGAAKAEAIIEYREANGGFAAPEEIMNIDGIKEKTFLRIKDRITI